VEGDVQPAGHRDLLAAQSFRRRRVVQQHVADLPGLPLGRPDGMARAAHLEAGQFVCGGVHGRRRTRAASGRGPPARPRASSAARPRPGRWPRRPPQPRPGSAW
jgi:hypothetical protein